MTTAIQVISNALPDALPRASIPFADHCLGLWFFGLNEAESRKNRIKGGLPLNVRGTGPTSFTATSMLTSVNANNYQTPFPIVPHSYTVGGFSHLGGLAANGVDPGPTYGWLPYCAGPDASLSATIFGPGSGYVAQTIGGESINHGEPDITATYVQRFNAISERTTGMDVCIEDGGPGGGICFVSLETPSPAAATARPINFGQALYGGAGQSSIGFVFDRPLTKAELNQVYLQVRRFNIARRVHG